MDEWRPSRRASVAYFVWLLLTLEARKLRRDTVLFLLGIFGIVWETVTAHPPSDTLITVFVGFCGMPVILRLDELRAYRRTAGRRDHSGDGDAS